MKCKRKRSLFILVALISLLGFTIAVKASSDDSSYVVKNFKVVDVPYDDGTGLQLSWNPLPKEKRIIEYRVYRGVTPDSLFLLGTIPINVKTGVAGDSVYYTDKDLNVLVDISAPGRLKKEKQQGAKSPLYGDVPRDVKVLNSIFSKYSFLSIIPKKDFYYRTTKTNAPDKADSTTYAGLKMRQVTLLASLNPNTKYYYTVVALDERRAFHKHAPVQSGIPVENAPEPVPKFSSVYVKDTNKMQFEWELPLFKGDLAQYQIYAVPASSQAAFDDFRLHPIPQTQSPGLPIAAGQIDIASSDSYNMAIVDMNGRSLNPDTIDQLRFAIGIMDYAGNEVLSSLVAPKVILSSQLPPRPTFLVKDKPNDKGEILTLTWNKPVVYVNQTNFISADRKKLMVNYMENVNSEFKIKKLAFDFYKINDTKPFKTHHEYYQDNKIIVTLPKDYNPELGLNVRIRITSVPAVSDKYVFTQNLVFNKQTKSMIPDKLMSDGKDVNEFSYVIYKKLRNSQSYTLSKKLNGNQNSFDDNIRFEKDIYKPVAYMDKKTNQVLVNSDIDITYDKKAKAVVQTSIYANEAKKLMAKQKKSLDDKLIQLRAQIPQVNDPQQLAQLQDQINKTTARLEMFNNPILKQSLTFTGDRSRMHFVSANRESNKRQASYRMIVSNGEGIFTESDITKDKDDETVYYTPVGNWFDKSKIPMLIASIVFGLLVAFMIRKAKLGHDLFIRPIAGIQEIDNAIGRATEMGKPILYCPGLGGLSDVATIASLGILGQVAKKTAEYDTKLIVPCYDFIMMPVAQEIVREAHYEAGRPDSYDKNNVFYLTNVQFAYVAGVNGIMIRENCATNFYMGMFYAEALLMTETGNTIGSIQIAGTDAVTQIPFFITTCDYTLIGEELYAASAYLVKEPMMLGTLKAQDYFKFLILFFVILGTVLTTSHITFLINVFPEK